MASSVFRYTYLISIERLTQMLTRKPVPQKSQRRGQGMVEYIFITAAVAFISLGALSHFGHKVGGQYAIAAGLLPGAHDEGNNAIATGHFAAVTEGTTVSPTGVVGWADITGTGNGSGSTNNVGGGREFVTE